MIRRGDKRTVFHGVVLVADRDYDAVVSREHLLGEPVLLREELHEVSRSIYARVLWQIEDVCHALHVQIDVEHVFEGPEEARHYAALQLAHRLYIRSDVFDDLALEYIVECPAFVGHCHVLAEKIE